MYASNYFIYSSNTNSLAFIIITFIFILFLAILNPIIKFKKIKSKWLTNRNLLFFAVVLGLIIGLIFSSLVNFNKLDKTTLSNNHWLWECISFVYSFGSLVISLMMLAVWFIVPLVSFLTIKKFLTRNDYNIDHELKKLGFVFIFVIVSIGLSNLGWIFPLNDAATPLKVFKIHNGSFLHDQWFVANKFMFEHAYLTQWYSWVFLAYFIINILIAYIILKIKVNDIRFLNNTEKKLHKIGNVFHIFDSFGALSGFCFITTYFLFNWQVMLIHMGYIMLILFACYTIITCLLVVLYGIKYKNESNKWSTLKELFQLGFINHFSINKPKHKFNAINITDVSIVAVVFTIYMGFAYNFDVNATGELFFNSKMHSFTFWFQIIVGAFLYNIVSESRSYNSSWTKMIFAESTYSVTPGMQTGILTWINPLFKPFSNFVNNMTALLV